MIITLASLVLFFHLFYFWALIRKDFSVVDIGWGLGFCIIALSTYLQLNNPSERVSVMTFLVVVWGLRLAIYLAKRNLKKGEDYRYTNMRSRWGKNANRNAYFYVFCLQAILLLMVSSPILFISYSSDSPWSFFDTLAVIVWVIGFLFESISDWQLMKFKSNIQNKGRVLTTGLWSLSRHPNYFGEFVLWWGIFLFSFADQLYFYSIFGPLLISFLLLRVSGVPILEKRYKENVEYKNYVDKTNRFFPWVRK